MSDMRQNIKIEYPFQLTCDKAQNALYQLKFDVAKHQLKADMWQSTKYTLPVIGWHVAKHQMHFAS